VSARVPNGFVFKAWPQLCDEIASTVSCASGVLDGEVCCLEADGRTDFYRLMFRRDRPFFYAFDLPAILDLALPGLDGYTIRHEVAAHVHTSHIPIVIVTGSTDNLESLKVNCLLRKPVSANAVVDAVAKCLLEEA